MRGFRLLNLQRASALALLGLVASCGPTPDFALEHKLQGAAWHQDSLLMFELHVEDTTQDYRVMMLLEYGVDYPYQNAYLFRDILSETQTEYQDTVELTLALPDGTWTGSGYGSVKTLELPYLEQLVRFPMKGRYIFRFKHGMRDDPLHGIQGMSLMLYPETNEPES